MAPKLTEEEIDDLIYFARTGDISDLSETLTALAAREGTSDAEILTAAKDESSKKTALHMAAGNGHLETVRVLLDAFTTSTKEEKQAFIDDVNEHGNTAMHWAALGGHLDTVKLLVERGALPALANESNYVPLDLAFQSDKKDVAEYFLSFLPSLEGKSEQEGLKAAVEAVELKEGKEEKEKA